MREVLNHLFEHKTLTRIEAEKVLTNIAKGNYSESEIAAFLTVYLMRSITVDELTGFRDALLTLCIRIDLSEFDSMDVCGTCLLYTSPSPRDRTRSRMPSSA